MTLLACLALNLVVIAGCVRQPPASAAVDYRAEVLKVVRENPQAVLDILSEHQQQRAVELQTAEEKRVLDRIAELDLQQLVGDSPVRGNPGRKLLMFEFSDFQCPFCARASETVRSFVDRHADEVTLVYKHLPLSDIHPEAQNAARAAYAANKQHKFWEYHDALFARQQELSAQTYREIAKSLHLDLKKFESDQNSPDSLARVLQDSALGQSLGIGGTPAFLLGREPFSGALPLSAMEEILARAKQNGSNSPAAAPAASP